MLSFIGSGGERVVSKKLKSAQKPTDRQNGVTILKLKSSNAYFTFPILTPRTNEVLVRIAVAARVGTFFLQPEERKRTHVQCIFLSFFFNAIHCMRMSSRPGHQ